MHAKAKLHDSRLPVQRARNIKEGYVLEHEPKSHEAILERLAALLDLDPKTLIYGETGNISGGKVGDMLDAIHLESVDPRPETATLHMYTDAFKWWATQTNQTLLRIKRPGQNIQYSRNTTNITILDASAAPDVDQELGLDGDTHEPAA